MKTALEKSNEIELEKNKAAIIMRFKFKESLYDYDIKNNITVAKAKNVLNNATD